ncbi:ParA family protein [Elusimicrobiota bacterium]
MINASGKTIKYALPFGELCSLIPKEPGEVIRLLPLNDRIEGHAATAKVASQDVRKVLAGLGFAFPFQTLAFMNLKGGVGKTTSAVTMASRAVQYGFRTCLLDLDAQASATLSFGVLPEEGEPIFNDVWEAPAEKVPAAVKDIEGNFSLLPSALENSLLDVSLMKPAAQKGAVKGVCDALRGLGFDLIIIDCPPALGAATISTVCAVDTVVVPVRSDAFSFRGVELTLAEVGTIRDTFGLEDVEIRILLTMVDRRQTLTHQFREKLENKYGRLLLPEIIRTSTEYPKALEEKETVFAHSRKSNAKADFDAVARKLLGLDSFFRQLRFPPKNEGSGREALSAVGSANGGGL